MHILQEAPADLAAYAKIPIGFQIESRVDLGVLTASGTIVEIPVEPRWKDYDLSAEDRPEALAARLAGCPHAIFAAHEGAERVGGAIVACQVPGYDFPDTTAILLDIRVDPSARGHGIGRALFDGALFWAIDNCYHDFVVETQDVNVAACRFYAAMECELLSADPNGYEVNSGEAKILWHHRLR